MKLAIDIGNTSITAGLFKARRLVKCASYPTNSPALRQFLHKFAGNKIDSIIIASVVPQATIRLVKELKSAFPDNKPIIVGRDLVVPVKNCYKYPKQVGQDRLVNAYAAIMLYGSPTIVVDFGTAITFDVISSKKEYKGGVILPGLQTSLNALAENTALLPQVSVCRPLSLIGRDTKESMLSGVINGFASLTDNLTAKLAAKIGKKSVVIGTGGHIYIIAPYCKSLTAIDQNLTLKGLALL
jgi:type III pantothenate kinase